MLVLAWAYAHHGRSIVGQGILFGVKPVVIAVVAQALWGLRRVAVPDAPAAVVAGGALGAYFAGVDVLVVLAAAALLLAFLHRDVVVGLGWLGNSRLLDAVAVGQLTPGPVFTTATFIGYLVAGVPGAVLATVGIFLPSFFMVAAVAPVIGRLRRSRWTAGILDGVNAAAIGLMTGVGIDLARPAFTGPLSVVLGVAAAVALLRFSRQLGVGGAGRSGCRPPPRLRLSPPTGRGR